MYTLYQIFYAAFPLNKFMQTQNASSCLHANMEIRLVVSRMEHIFWEISSTIKIFIYVIFSWFFFFFFFCILHGPALLPLRDHVKIYTSLCYNILYMYLIC